MGAEKHNGVANYCRRPVQRPFLQRIQYAIWNPEERTFLGRTPKRWGVIGLIYLVMYICIIIFFSICMCGLLATMDERVPYFQLADSIIGDNPGMGHRPLLYEEGNLVWYEVNNDTQIKRYVDNINEFLAPYENKSLLVNGGVNQRDCGTDKPPRAEVCAFNTSQLGPCSAANSYGYKDNTPCFIIKLNRIYNWNPDYYDDPHDLPPDMPADIKDYIVNKTTTPIERRKVWLSCKGERPGDVEALGPLSYYPYPGIDETFFPYDNTPGYLSPLVAVQLLKPVHQQIINVRCRAWARNIQYTDSLKDRIGSTHFEIMIDEPPKGDNPGMDHRPLLFEEGTLVWYQANNDTQIKRYVDNINEFLAPYENKSLLVNGGVNQRDCGTEKPPRAEVCAFNTSQLGPCSAANSYGYKDNSPCFIIKLNRIYNWNPDYYDDPHDLPPDMPADIKDYIVNNTTTRIERRKVWLSCKGERPEDVEALGPLSYYPYPGIDETFFPDDNTPGYLSPLVAVQLLKPVHRQIINVHCRAWARNIQYTDSVKNRIGSTHFEIKIDDPPID